ncbi:hypothetical protein [Streptomyces sp. H34-S4]|uniref:hypothetical protein n=1 Tax=Streptomyces sp. H34-S4 TaxID=2996463 RepID=UPI002270453A|nr:hypothetical protein [Streptomyces sp. H34-S4]MCY0933913.1 hypothetical protein [Streptomyces sp. H34-S4]
MAESEPDPRYEQSFEQWLERVQDELGWEIAQSGPVDWIRDVYHEHGELPSDQFARIAFERKARSVLDALPPLTAVAEQDTNLHIDVRPEFIHPSTDSPGGIVTVAESAIQSFDPAGVRAEVADAVQTYLADRYGRLWPLCPEHDRGLHAVAHEGEALWWCTAKDHRSSRIPLG